MRPSLRSLVLAACAFGAASVHAQASSPAPAGAEELRRLCETVSMQPADGREFARRAECVLSGVLPSADRIGEARRLARAALKAEEPAGGLMLYLAFLQDPKNQALRDGKLDPEAYARLAARSLKDRTEQVEAIEGLGFAAGRNNAAAGMLLANYFHDTVAPGNLVRLAAIAAMLKHNGHQNAVLDRFAREADAIARAGNTHASPRSFLEAYRNAAAVASAGYGEQAGGKTCGDVQLASVSTGEIADAEYLPLTGKLVANTYLVRGHWSEFWTFRACGEEVPVKVSFRADGWGGSTSTAVHNKGG